MVQCDPGLTYLRNKVGVRVLNLDEKNLKQKLCLSGTLWTCRSTSCFLVFWLQEYRPGHTRRHAHELICRFSRDMTRYAVFGFGDFEHRRTIC